MAKFVFGCSLAVVAAASQNDPNVLKEWEEFKSKYGKTYKNHDVEAHHLIQFQSNLKLIAELNGKQLSFVVGVNEYADLSWEEFKSARKGLMPPSVWDGLPYLGKHNYSGSALPDAVDWVEKGAVTSVKNQGQCGSCWAFSTTGSLEGRWQIASGNLVPLSEQQFVDCDTDQDSGCNGGLMDNAFAYAEKNGICTEESYAYRGSGGACAASSCTVGIPKGSVTGFMDVTREDAEAMKEAVSQGPVSVAIEADHPAFQLYTGGILSSNFCGDSLDHGVLVVGYGEDSGKPYWKVKNSWGANWGEHGYIRMERGAKRTGECGILDGPPSYPVVQASTTVVV